MLKKKKQKNKIRRSGNKPSKSRGQGVSLKHDLRGFIEILNSVVLWNKPHSMKNLSQY